MATLTDDCIIHLLDDDAAVRDSLQFMLETKGCKASVHSNLNSFLKSFNSTDKCCLILDIRLDGMSGLDVQKSLLPRYKIKIPIIFITGHSDEDIIKQATAQSGCSFLEKPFETQVLIQHIDKALESQCIQ